MKKLLLPIIISIVVMLTGCGVNIKQDGNKIFTDISKDEAYDICQTVLETKGYKITEVSKKEYFIHSIPKNNATFKLEGAEKLELDVLISEGKKENETMVVLYALIDGRVDEKKSISIAQAAIEDIIRELNKYGKYSVKKTGTYQYPAATQQNVNDYIETYLKNNISTAKVDRQNNSFTVVLKEANNRFNEPLSASIDTMSDETGKIIVNILAEIKGNYAIQDSEADAEKFIAQLLTYLQDYPALTKSLRQSYKYIDTSLALAHLKTVLVESGYFIQKAGSDTLIAQKNKLKLEADLMDLNLNAIIDIRVSLEGSSPQERNSLNTKIDKELASLREMLSAFQTIYTGKKTFTSTNVNNVYKYTGQALKKLNYTYEIDQDNSAIYAIARSNKYLAHYIAVNEQGYEGVTLEINTLYNTRYSQAKDLVRRENQALLQALRQYDKSDYK